MLASALIKLSVEEALGRVKCVLVLWSKTSVESEYVEAEAHWAWKKKKLVSVTLDSGLELHIPFNTTHSESLIGWSGDTSAKQYRKLVSDLSKAVGPPVGIEVRRKEDSKEVQKGVGTDLVSFACAYCGASGKSPYASAPCPICNGRGAVKMPIVDRMQCRYCGGKGKDPFEPVPCQVCKGFGFVDR